MAGLEGSLTPCAGQGSSVCLKPCCTTTARSARNKRFYGDVLGLPAVAGWEDGVAFRIGAGVLLLFDRDQLALRAGPIADHGTSGAGHACLQARGADTLSGGVSS